MRRETLHNWQSNQTKCLVSSGIISSPPLIKDLSIYMFQTITPSTLKIDISAIASILREAIQSIKTGTSQQVIDQINKEIFKFFKKIANAFNKTLPDETEIPEIIDFLRQNGYITEKSSAKLLDLLLIIDGLKFQNEILDEDIELILKISDELEEVKISYPEDCNLYTYINVVEAETLSSGGTITL